MFLFPFKEPAVPELPARGFLDSTGEAKTHCDRQDSPKLNGWDLAVGAVLEARAAYQKNDKP